MPSTSCCSRPTTLPAIDGDTERQHARQPARLSSLLPRRRERAQPRNTRSSNGAGNHRKMAGMPPRSLCEVVEDHMTQGTLSEALELSDSVH